MRIASKQRTRDKRRHNDQLFSRWKQRLYGLTAALVTASVVAACGGQSSSDAGTPTTRDTASIATTLTTQARKGPAPTRLVAGPVLFRVTGAPKPTSTDATAQVLYAMIFRLDRTPRAGADMEVPALDPIGNYSLINPSIGWGHENGILRFGKPRLHCFVGLMSTDIAPPELRAVRLGQRVHVTLQPTTPTANGGLELGTIYERFPRLLRADNNLRNRRARNALNRIGCPADRLA